MRAAIGREICAAAVGDRRACELPPAITPLEKAVDSAFEDARPLLISVRGFFDAVPKNLSPASAETDVEARNRLAREAWLSHEELLRAVVPRVKAALSANGISCRDCPSFDARPLREIEWDDFSRYVSAFVWPDPVETPVGSPGKPAGKPRYSFHICSGLDAASNMKDPDPDPVLLRAGFMAASSPAIRERAGDHFGEILNEEGFILLVDDNGRTQYLRDHLAPMLQADPAVRKRTCEVFEKYGADLGLKLTDCPLR